jgi:type IV pilus assembly protein PilY1
VIILSDGLPSSDQSVSSYFQDYDGDCHDANGNLLTGKCGSYDMKKAYAYPGTDSVGTTPILTVTGGGSSSSVYLDDVAQALYEMDLRPDLAKATGEKNNITTYTVGSADPAFDPLLPGVNPLLKDTATQGGGQFFFSGDATTLADALDSITTDIISKISSSSSATANSAKLVSSAAVYQGKFDSSDWTGSLSMFPLGVSEDTNGNGILDPGEDKNNNGILDGGAIGTDLWNAAEHIPAYGSTSSRNILLPIRQRG